MITAAASASTKVAEELLSYFVDIGNKECFAATLYICFDLLRPDTVEELSWQHGLNDFYMPYKIQQTRSLAEKVCCLRILMIYRKLIVSIQISALEKKVEEHSKKEVQKEQQESEAPMINPGGFGNRLMLTQGNG